MLKVRMISGLGRVEQSIMRSDTSATDSPGSTGLQSSSAVLLSFEEEDPSDGKVRFVLGQAFVTLDAGPTRLGRLFELFDLLSYFFTPF